jgi:predicted nucleic acid-binding protein
MKVVSNTGPLIHLLEADALYLLQLTGDVYIPKAVDLEMKHHFSFWNIPEWLNVMTLHNEVLHVFAG